MSATILGNPVAAMIEGAIGAPHKRQCDFDKMSLIIREILLF